MKACVLGCGVSGKGAISLLQKKGYVVFGIDRISFRYKDVPIFKESETDLSNINLMVVSPGIYPDHFLIEKAKALGIEVIGEIELGLRYLDSFCIGITGTNGKTTTCELITHILNENKIKAICLGNCGNSLCEKVLELEKEMIVVLELSSYQIEWIESKKITIGCILNIEQDHLDRYSSFNNYALAKLRLLEFVKEKIFVKKDALEIVDLVKKNKSISFDDEQIVATLKELGYINKETAMQENLFAAWRMVERFLSKENFLKGARTFKKSNHRLEKVGMFNGVTIYNDSKSTNPASVCYAVDVVSEPMFLLLGGKDKGLSFSKILERKEKISRIVCFGQSSHRIASELSSLKPTVVSTVEEAAKFAIEIAEPGEAIVFSPGGSSFDAFKDYQERGSFFKKIILQYIGEMK